VVACADGPDLNSGTSFEVGFAFGRRPVVLYRTDTRRGGKRSSHYECECNLMLWEVASARVPSSRFSLLAREAHLSGKSAAGLLAGTLRDVISLLESRGLGPADLRSLLGLCTRGRGCTPRERTLRL
jgi:hypothetical protein